MHLKYCPRLFGPLWENVYDLQKLCSIQIRSDPLPPVWFGSCPGNFLDPIGPIWIHLASSGSVHGNFSEPIWILGADPVFLLKLEGVRSDLDTAQFLEVIYVFPEGSKKSGAIFQMHVIRFRIISNNSPFMDLSEAKGNTESGPPRIANSMQPDPASVHGDPIYPRGRFPGILECIPNLGNTVFL